jgi:hypothetical protein
MSTVSITRDLEPYLDSLRLYLATDNPAPAQSRNGTGSPSKSDGSRPMGLTTRDKQMNSGGETNGGADVQASNMEDH